MRRAWLSSLLVLAGWAAAGAPGGLGWECGGNQGLANAIEKLAGPNAVDCGFHEMIGKTSFRARRLAHECVGRALQDHRPFKFATSRIPLDSFVTEVLVRSAEGKLWIIVIDEMIGEQPTQWTAVCKHVSVDRRTLYLDRNESCVDHPLDL
jgi:hypothetical protein